MYTFIDEAGVFNIPDHRKWSISCVGGLVIPDENIDFVYDDFLRLKRGLGYQDKEIKGSKLNEPEITALIHLLRKYDVIFEVTAIDMKLQNHRKIFEHRQKQAEKFTEHLTEKHHPALIEEFVKLKKNLKSLSNPLYVQAICTFEVLYNVLCKATLYYSQRKPKELDKFFWIIDAKDKKLTPYEKLWATIILPLLQSKSFKDPFIQLIEADYSYFDKYCKESEEPPEHLKDISRKSKPFYYIEIKDIYKQNLSFEKSHQTLGLQIVDILTTGIRRAMNGNLQSHVGGTIGELMVHPLKEKQTIKLIDLCGIIPHTDGKNPPYWAVIELTNRNSKNLLKQEIDS